MIVPVSNYIIAVDNFKRLARTLRIDSIERDKRGLGAPRCIAGNRALIFKVERNGRHYAMRLYIKPHPNLAQIYGEEYYPDELLVYADNGEELYADIVLTEWHEGVDMLSYIEQNYRNREAMARLTHQFEELALWLLGEEWAHGDIKCENIIVGEDGLHLIDFDALYTKGFHDNDCIELGTRAYQHPHRCRESFNSTIDHYPLALISTVLNALLIEPELGSKIGVGDTFLIEPLRAISNRDAMLDHIERLFVERGDVRNYRIANLLRSPSQYLHNLDALLAYRGKGNGGCKELQPYLSGGLWGYESSDGRYTPPLFDDADDFSEGLAAVKVGREWFFLNCECQIKIDCGVGEMPRPFKGEVTTMRREGGPVCIYKDGRIEPLNQGVCTNKR